MLQGLEHMEIYLSKRFPRGDIMAMSLVTFKTPCGTHTTLCMIDYVTPMQDTV